MAHDKAHSRSLPPSLSPRALAVAGWSAFVLAGVLFLAIAWNVAVPGWLAALDARLAESLHARAGGAAVAVFLVITHLNSTVAICAWSVVFAAWLARARERAWMLTLGAAVGGALVVNALLKLAYERLRPRFDDPLVELATYSFPSGHTAGAVAFYGVLAAFLVSRTRDPRRRAACVAGAIGAVALVAFSRIYLGAHYLSDVVAAVCSSTAWLVLCLASGHALVRGRLKLRWVLFALAALVAVAGAVVLPLHDWSDRLQAALGAMSLGAGLVAFALAAMLATLVLIPGWIFPLVAGAVFGFGWGLLAATLAMLASAVAGFALARTVLKGPVQRMARKSRYFKAVDNAMAKGGWKVVALMRMSPFMPSGLKSYFLGLTRVPLPDYVIGSAAGMLPGIALKVYVGAAGRGALAEGGGLNWTLFAAGIAATVALGWWLRRAAKKKFKL
ncbi:MAG TPA: VTT domain-containing protein, partial [Burkholderiales bacterium]|nr:VTT domain-containing protein [Burkholderiales bacterium]